MGKIKILPDTLISQIAAGEVVERPASVVKELLENSLDAGATHCGLEIEQGGMKLLLLRDNGCGMNKEDAKMAFARHATSKIATLSDLTNIRSFGFRGEALAAIASVAIVEMRTKEVNSDVGHEIICRGGEFESEKSVGCPYGTEIAVRNLFFNTPARKKFLKTETTELSHIVAVVSHVAIANPNVGFELKHNGKTLIQASATPSKQIRLAEILGKNILGEILPVNFKTESIHIHGFIGRPGMEISSKRHQYLFVNGRDTTDSLVAKAIGNAYGSRIPGRSYPMFVLHIDIDPAEVDVNVHPRKLTVKFQNTQRIFRDVFQATNQALDEFQAKMFVGTEVQSSFDKLRMTANTPRHAQRDMPSVQDALTFTENLLETERQPGGLKSQPIQPTILGQLANSYILILDEEGLAVIDQHAAHERILYEKIKAGATNAKMTSQQLIVPLSIDCSREEAVFLHEAVAHLKTLGFEFDEWSGNTFVIRACPTALRTQNLQKIFRDFLDEMTGEAPREKILPERILKSLACKAAVKFGMQLAHQEQVELIMELQKTPNSATCPHGRPTKVLLTFAELEKRFYRRK
ncbi:DNA mismatch repair endonuclease MutL [Candidatus Peregrinibacteria bacterium]|nr:DNA mismatch repair endonuclease MutL [Candidatus Peregrinibacteria bacterium]